MRRAISLFFCLFLLRSHDAGVETDPRRRAAGHTARLPARNLRADERLLEERPEGASAVRRRARPPEERDQAPGAGQPAAPAARVAVHRRPPEPEEDPVRRAAGRRELLTARRAG